MQYLAGRPGPNQPPLSRVPFVSRQEHLEWRALGYTPVHVGKAVHPDPADYVCADDVIDDASNRRYDDGGEFAEDYPGDISEEAKDEPNHFLRAWLRTYCAPSFYTVENESPYVLPATDFAGRQSSEVQP